MPITNKHQQPSFKFETNIAKYTAKYQDWKEGDEKWDVQVIYNSSEKISGSFSLPITWSREIVFAWLSNMEISSVTT